MIKTIMIPVSWEMSQEEYFFAQNRGEIPKMRIEREQEQNDAQRELGESLADGYNVIASHVVKGAQRTLITFTLYKAPESKSDPR